MRPLSTKKKKKLLNAIMAGGAAFDAAIGAMSFVSVAPSNIIGGDNEGLARISAGYQSFGMVDNAGSQNAYDVDLTTGQTRASRALFGPVAVDDHNDFAMLDTSSGATIAAACDHNQNSFVQVRYSATGDLGAFAAKYNLVTSNKSTYPNLFERVGSGECYLYYRVNQVAWEIAKTLNFGSSFATPITFVSSGTDQMYIKAGMIDADRLLCIAYVNPAVGAGYVKCATINFATGAIVSGSGTIGNLGTPGTLPTALSDWSTIYTDPGTGLPAIPTLETSLFAKPMFVMTVGRADQQYYEYFVGEFTGSNLFSSSDWTITDLNVGSYGVADKNPVAPPFLRPGKLMPSKTPGLADIQLHMSRLNLGQHKLSTWDRMSGTFRPTASYVGAKRPISLSDAAFRPIAMASDKARFLYSDGYYPGYGGPFDQIGMKAAVVTRKGTTAPVLIGNPAFTTSERHHFAANIQALYNQPVNFWISGGADAAFFTADDDELHFYSQKYSAPADANADNRYEVQITAISLSGNTTVTNLTFDVTQIASFSPSALNKWTRDLSHTATGWTYTSLTPTGNDAATLDAYGTVLACREVQTATAAVNHRGQQTLTATPAGSTLHTVTLVGKPRGSNFAASNVNDGVQNFGVIWDLARGVLVAPRSGGGAIAYWGREQLLNNFWALWFGFVTNPTPTAASTILFSTKGWGGSVLTEDGATANSCWLMDVSVYQGDFGGIPVRTV